MPTEYGGKERIPNGVQPKGEAALTASEKMRLIYLTGQDKDSKAPVNKRAWTGEST